MKINHTIPNAFGRNETTVVKTETDDTKYTFFVTDGEVERVGWESKNYGDYGTKAVGFVNNENKKRVLNAARNA